VALTGARNDSFCEVPDWPWIGTAITVAASGIVIVVLMETLRNIWLNWGWQYPVWSSVGVAFISVALWWIFGGIIYLSDPSLHKSHPEASVQTPQPAVPDSASTSSKSSTTVNANGTKLPGTETNKPTKVVTSGVTNEEIFSLFNKGDTSLKVSRALEPYVGTVMTIDGKLIQIHAGSGGGPIALSMRVNNGPGASCVFDAEWVDHLDALKRDQEITVRGKIRPEPAGNDLQLIECELIEAKSDASPSQTPESKRHSDIKSGELNVSTVTNKHSEIWDGIRSAWEEAFNLRQEWQQNDRNPPLQKTEDFVNRTLAFAKTHLTLDEIRKLDSPYEQRANIFDPMQSQFAMVNYWWGRLLDYERHLQQIMQTFGRPTPVVQPSSLHDAVAHLGVIGAGILPLQTEALPISARTENHTQLGSSITGGPIFRGKCIFSIHNPNPTHGFTGIGCRLISIAPPFRSAAGYRAMTENYTLRRIKFSIDDIEDNKLRGDQTAHVHILTAERKPFAEPKSLKNITINIEGKWPEQSANKFTPPQVEHILTLEVFGDGLQTKQERFQLSFSKDFKDDVFSITKLPS
jgi:hypothetical protein